MRLVQFNSDLLTKDEDLQAKAYYDKLYSGVRRGYYRFGPTWEIPKWMAEVAYNFPEADILFADSMDDIYDRIDDTNCERPDALAFSALDCNKHLIREIANRFSGQIFVGGYCDQNYFSVDCPENSNIYMFWMNSVEELCHFCGRDYKSGVSYQHFAGAKTIARLTMSIGCRHHCKFCTVPNDIIKIPREEVFSQADDITRHLNSPLIYLDDKTFGQAENFWMLPQLFQHIASRMNEAFDGFIIQTTASQLLKLDDDFLLQSGIRYVELGVESYNDRILRAMRKPVSERIIQTAVNKLKRLGISVIPNIMIGLPEETPDSYRHTIQWLHKNIDAISHVNVYTYVDYNETETVDENRGGDTKQDKKFAEAVYEFGNRCLEKG